MFPPCGKKHKKQNKPTAKRQPWKTNNPKHNEDKSDEIIGKETTQTLFLPVLKKSFVKIEVAFHLLFNKVFLDSIMIIKNIIDNVETKFPNYADYQKIRSDFFGFQKLHASNKFAKKRSKLLYQFIKN